MINVNQITSQLARMPDQALQQYAQMHKSDPYIMALALSESNRRKQMRSGAQMNAPEQPKVVDQEIQSMAAPMPENVGIGQLPAGDMNFADGGIVAFGSGGDVPRYNGSMGSFTATQPPVSVQELSRLYQQDPKLAREAALRAGPAGARILAQIETLARGVTPASAVMPLAALQGGTAASLAAARTMGQMSPEQREGFYSSPIMGAMGGDAGLAAAIMNAPGMEPPKSTSGSQIGKALLAIPRILVSDPSLAQERDAQKAKNKPAPSAAEIQQAMDAGSFARPAAPPPAAPKPDAGARSSGQRAASSGLELLGGPGAGAAPAAGLASLPRMPSPTETYQSVLDTVPLVDPAAGQREALGSEIIGGAERRARTLKEDIAKEGDVFAGRGERIGQRESKLKNYESTNQSLALLNAGLAIMSTPGGLATAIGKGARVGTEQYAAGLDKIRAAQERLEDAKDNLDTLRLNRADMNRKEVRAAEADIDRAKTDAKRLGIEGIMAASDLRQKQASDLFKGTLEQAKTVYTVAGDLQGRQIAANATMAAANAPGAQERMFSRLGGGDLRKGMQAYSDIMGPEAKGQAAILQKFATADGQITLRMMESSDDPQQRALAQSIRSQLQVMMVPGAQNAPGAGGARP